MNHWMVRFLLGRFQSVSKSFMEAFVDFTVTTILETFSFTVFRFFFNFCEQPSEAIVRAELIDN